MNKMIFAVAIATAVPAAAYAVPAVSADKPMCMDCMTKMSGHEMSATDMKGMQGMAMKGHAMTGMKMPGEDMAKMPCCKDHAQHVDPAQDIHSKNAQ